MKFSAAIVVCAVAASLAGCGVVAKVNARNEMTQSEATYKACLAQHPQDIRPCDGARLAYEADLQMYRETSGGIRPGYSDSIHVTTGR